MDFNRSEKSKQQLATSIEEFDPAKDVWRQLMMKGAPHPGLSAVACASFGGYLYAFGGFDGELLFCTLSRLELKTLTWSKLSAMDEDGPMRKDASGMVYVDGDRESVNSGLDYWNGLLDWTSGLTFDLKFSHEIGHTHQINSYK